MSDSDSPIARLLPTPFTIDWISSPEIIYNGKEGPSVIYHFTDDEGDERYRPLRITFEDLDSMRVCRGEYSPYPKDSQSVKEGILFVVENSPWLRERYNYESKHYRNCYEWGGNVDEMLTDFRHFHFAFHDEFVDVIASGIWFEQTDKRQLDWKFPSSHPFSRMSIDAPIVEHHTYGEDELVIRRSAKTLEELERDSVYCSQPLFGIGTEDAVKYQLVVRTPYGATKTCLMNTMSTVCEERPGIASIEEAWAMYESYRNK